MSLKITTLIENLPDKEGKLQFEHGFSVWIETADKRILFDTGQSGAFTRNAAAMGIDLATADMVVLSHGHYDHTGGVPELLSIRKEKTLFYAGKEFFYQNISAWKTIAGNTTEIRLERSCFRSFTI